MIDQQSTSQFLSEDEEEDEEGCLQLEEGSSSKRSEGRYTTLCSIRQKKIGLLLFSVLYIPLFAGAFFGFGPMQIMLEESGAFASVCSVDENTTQADGDDVCPDQTARLLTM